MKCQNPECNNETNNPKFCSRSCSAIVTNATHPRRKKAKPRKCLSCSTLVYWPRKLCDECLTKRRRYLHGTVTIGAIHDGAQYQKSAAIRSNARAVFRSSLKSKSCLICGYKKHYEVCHIQPITSFSQDTPISEVNDIENLVALCPNHHWELDHNVLTVEEILSVRSLGIGPKSRL